MSMKAIWSRRGRVEGQKMHAGGGTYEASACFVTKFHVCKAIQPISLRLFALGKEPSILVLRSLVEECRKTLHPVVYFEKHDEY